MMNLQSDTLVVATKNKGKVKEFEHAFEPHGIRVKSMYDYENLPEVVEDGDTFEANALKKARTVAKALGLPVLADDSGLCVEALEGSPGVYSARYAGEQANDEDNNAKLLSELERLQQGEDTQQPLLSPAQFVCVLVLYNPADDHFVETRGSVDGWITSEAAGCGGFGYDPLFYLSDYDKTMAELTMEQKQSISHRGAALRQLMAKLQTEQSK